MKSYLTSFFLLVLLFPLMLKAQQEKRYRYYIKYPNQLVKTEQEADFIRILQVDSNSAIFTEKYKNGKLRRSGTAQNRDISFEAFGVHGPSFSVYPNGKVARIVQYNKGKITGDDSCFYNNGRLLSVRTYQYKQENGRTVESVMVKELRERDGKVLVSNGNGWYRDTEPDSLFLMGSKYHMEPKASESGKIVNGYKDGLWVGTIHKGSYKETFDVGTFLNGVAYTPDRDSVVYTQQMQLPSFGENIKEFYRFISKEFRYPLAALRNGISGRVLLAFTVNTQGFLEDIKILQDPGFGTAQEAIRVLKKSGRWLPGKIHGIPVRMFFTLPIVLESSPRQISYYR